MEAANRKPLTRASRVYANVYLICLVFLKLQQGDSFINSDSMLPAKIEPIQFKEKDTRGCAVCVWVCVSTRRHTHPHADTHTHTHTEPPVTEATADAAVFTQSLFFLQEMCKCSRTCGEGLLLSLEFLATNDRHVQLDVAGAPDGSQPFHSWQGVSLSSFKCDNSKAMMLLFYLLVTASVNFALLAVMFLPPNELALSAKNAI